MNDYRNILLGTIVALWLGAFGLVIVDRAFAGTITPVFGGGTSTSTQVTNGVNFFDGTKITSGTGLTFNGTDFGVGTSTPSSYLTVQGSGNGNAGTLSVNTTGTGPQIAANFNNTDMGVTTSAARLVLSEGNSWYQGISGAYNNSAPYMAFSVNSTANTWAEKMRLTSGGNLGIGTTTPGTRLAVYGAQEANGPIVFTGSGLGGFTVASSSAWYLYQDTDQSFKFGRGGYNPVLQFTFANNAASFSGSVAVGTTGSTSPSATLSVAGSGFIQNGLGIGTLNSTAGTLVTTGNIGVGTSTPGSLLSIGVSGNASGINFGLATSTFSNAGGINLTTGCFAINGTCISGSGGGGGVTSVSGTTNQITSSGGTTPVLSLPNLVIFPSNASSTVFSNFGTAYFGGSSTTTISSTGAITTPAAAVDSFANASTTNLTAGTSLGIPTGSNPAPKSAGYIAQSTNSPYQLQVGNGGSSAIFDPRIRLTLSYATSTTWTGTTTLPAFPINQGITWNTESCTAQPSGATVEVGYQYANSSAYTSVISYQPASTTPGVYSFSSNNTPTSNATSTISFGNPSGSPTSVSCTLVGAANGV